MKKYVMAMLVALVCALVPATAHAATVSDGWTEVGTCEYKIEGDTLTYRPLGNEASGILPDSNPSTPLPGVNNTDVKHVVFAEGVKAGTSLNAAFVGCSNLLTVDLSNLDTSATTDMMQMFVYCSSLSLINLSNINRDHGLFLGHARQRFPTPRDRS